MWDYDGVSWYVVDVVNCLVDLIELVDCVGYMVILLFIG